MKIAATLILSAIALLALLLLLMGVLGVSVGFRVGGDLFADEGLNSISPVHLILLMLASAGGLFLLWRGSRRAG